MSRLLDGSLRGCLLLAKDVHNEAAGKAHTGLCSNAFAFASANANAAFALALAFDCPAADAYALAFAFDSSAFALALAFDSNAFDWNQMRNKCESNAKQIRIK